MMKLWFVSECLSLLADLYRAERNVQTFLFIMHSNCTQRKTVLRRVSNAANTDSKAKLTIREKGLRI